LLGAAAAGRRRRGARARGLRAPVFRRARGRSPAPRPPRHGPPAPRRAPAARPRPGAEPLLAPPEGRAWKVGWSSEEPRYGGGGTPPVEVEGGFFLPGHAAIGLTPGGAR